MRSKPIEDGCRVRRPGKLWVTAQRDRCPTESGGALARQQGPGHIPAATNGARSVSHGDRVARGREGNGLFLCLLFKGVRPGPTHPLRREGAQKKEAWRGSGRGPPATAPRGGLWDVRKWRGEAMNIVPLGGRGPRGLAQLGGPRRFRISVVKRFRCSWETEVGDKNLLGRTDNKCRCAHMC